MQPIEVRFYSRILERRTCVAVEDSRCDTLKIVGYEKNRKWSYFVPKSYTDKRIGEND